MRPLDGDAEDQCYQNIDDKLKLSGIQSRTKWRAAMSWQLVPTIQQRMLLAYFQVRQAVLVPKKIGHDMWDSAAGVIFRIKPH